MAEGKFRCQAALPRPSGPHLLVLMTPKGGLLPCRPVPLPTQEGLLVAFGPDLRSPRLIEADPLITTGLTSGAERPQVCSRIPGGMSVCVHVCGGEGRGGCGSGKARKTHSWELICPWVSPPIKWVPTHFLGSFPSCSSEKESCFHLLERESE